MAKRTQDVILLLILAGGFHIATSCRPGTDLHMIKGKDGTFDSECCRSAACDRGTAGVLCSREGGSARCEDCDDGFFQSVSGPSYRITSCFEHRTCSYKRGYVLIENGTSVSDVVCGCDFHRGYVAAEEIRKNPDGDTYRLVENPESCRESKCSELKREGEYVTCVRALSSEKTTALSTSSQSPTHERELPSHEGSEENNHSALNGGVIAISILITVVGLVVGGLLTCRHKRVLCFRPRDNERDENRSSDTNSASETESSDSLLKKNVECGNAGNRNDIMVAIDMRPVPTTFPQQETERKLLDPTVPHLEDEAQEENEAQERRVEIKNDGLLYGRPRDEEDIVILTSDDTGAAASACGSNVHRTNAADDEAGVNVTGIHAEQDFDNGPSEHAPVHNTTVNQGTTTNNYFNGPVINNYYL